MRERRSILYTGQVQGVGFRYTTSHIAKSYAVAGYVRNLPNGKVELVVEGESEIVAAFLRAVADRMVGYIEDSAVETHPATGEFDAFDIRR